VRRADKRRRRAGHRRRELRLLLVSRGGYRTDTPPSAVTIEPVMNADSTRPTRPSG
jgi:hypothetical protein